MKKSLVLCTVALLLSVGISTASAQELPSEITTVDNKVISVLPKEKSLSVIFFGNSMNNNTKLVMRSISRSASILSENVKMTYMDISGTHSILLNAYNTSMWQGISTVANGSFLAKSYGLDTNNPLSAVIVNSEGTVKSTLNSVTEKTLLNAITNVKETENQESINHFGPRYYEYKNIDGTYSAGYSVSKNQKTVLIFSNANCSNTLATLSNIKNSSLSNRSDVRFVFVESTGASLNTVKELANKFGNGNMEFTYDTYGVMPQRALNYYVDEVNFDLGASPYMVYLDEANNTMGITNGLQTIDEIEMMLSSN